MTTVYLIYGFLGAGKTTFSKRLAEQHAAIRFSIDEWYLQLFTEGTTYHVDRLCWNRLEETLHSLWPQIAAHGIDVVLDWGFWSRDLRDRVRSLARSVGVETCLYWVQCPEDTALRRCLARNGMREAFLISEESFQEIKRRFEPLGGDEEFVVIEHG
jgi:predicted kinase